MENMIGCLICILIGLVMLISGVYEYEYRGNIYHINSLVSTTGNVKIGKKKKIYVNPNQPGDCMIDAWVYVFTASILIAIALLFMVIGFAVL